jgi:DNA invertase Pin-like site-specific DNA recombinase
LAKTVRRRTPNYNRAILERRIAHYLQEVEFRKVDANLLERNQRRIESLLETGKVKNRDRDTRPAAGTVLTREYRDAGHAYIASQRAEGWIPVADDYDDPAFSGGHMERPALRRMMTDIEAGWIDVVVNYKIDRLTRSLADFSKMVEVFERYGVSFVSVTQQFNTTTSMGRLMLNILLSFAQFEREVTGEWIRDKIAASKAKGMWMGGVPPLGYDVENRRLVPERSRKPNSSGTSFSALSNSVRAPPCSMS